jgi:putative toxin-antitoxin system antitoxin component (TIGR02293 family)
MRHLSKKSTTLGKLEFPMMHTTPTAQPTRRPAQRRASAVPSDVPSAKGQFRNDRFLFTKSIAKKAFGIKPETSTSSDSPIGLTAHDLVTQGLRVADAKQVLKEFTVLTEKQFYNVLGITARTMQRRAASATQTLDANASDRVLRLVSVIRQASEVMGSQVAAERWLSSPAMGLDQRVPIDLLQSSEGTALVKTLLSRMDYGVYA